MALARNPAAEYTLPRSHYVKSGRIWVVMRFQWKSIFRENDFWGGQRLSLNVVSMDWHGSCAEAVSETGAIAPRTESLASYLRLDVDHRPVEIDHPCVLKVAGNK
jgi:hypothetical protein